MYQYTCLNPIAGVGLDLFSDEYQKVDDLKDAQAALVRSAAMHDLDLPDDALLHFLRVLPASSGRSKSCRQHS